MNNLTKPNTFTQPFPLFYTIQDSTNLLLQQQKRLTKSQLPLATNRPPK